jgi:KRAB domain-containing zinc finger protein
VLCCRTEVRDKFSITCRDRGLHPDHFPARPESGAGRTEETSSDSSVRRGGSGATDASPGTVECREIATSPLPVVDSSRDRGTQTAPPSLPWQCRRCGRAFRYRSALRRHYTAHTGARTGSRPQPPPPVPARLRCSWCRCALESKAALLAHVCPEKLKRPKCPDCGREFRQRRNMLAHQRICRGEDRLTCEECGGKVKGKHALGRHMLIHRSGPMNCHICAKSFTKESDLKRHERTHDKVKSHVCETCGKLFSSTSNYNQHVRKVHKGAKAFKCTECPKSYPYRSSLKLHMKSHGGEKTFACDQCDKKFLYKNNLTRHLKSHEAAPPIKCTKCDSVFSGKSLLKSHALTCY